jgi:GT2 family glycosyltransferase
LDKVKIVVATRATEADFYQTTATGRSLRLYKAPFLEVCLFPENKLGLPKIYNSVIDQSANDPAMLVFAHDDLHILDFFWIGELFNGLSYFQILGMAGNIRRIPRQPGWAFIDTNFTWDSPENLSGVVGHGQGFPPSSLSVFGPPRQQVKLLDGLLLCASSKTLNDNNLRFDERFDFHFYDMDFCRQAEQKDITCGTWSLSLIHESGGSFGTESWLSAYQKYLEKWGD